MNRFISALFSASAAACLRIGYRGLGRMGTGSKHGLETEDYLYATIFHVPRSKSPPIFFLQRGRQVLAHCRPQRVRRNVRNRRKQT